MAGTAPAGQDAGAIVWAVDGNREVAEAKKGDLWYG